MLYSNIVERVKLCLGITGILVASGLIWLPRAGGQVLYGSLTGNVTDPSGAAVPGAHVEAVNQGTNVKRDTTTDNSGVYRFTDLQPGLYTVTVSAPAFQTFSETGVQVQANAVRRVNVQFQVATISQKIEVSASAMALQTDKADIETQISTTEVAQLPYNGSEGKNFQALLLLQPGRPHLRELLMKRTPRQVIHSEPSRSSKTASLRKRITQGLMALWMHIPGCL